MKTFTFRIGGVHPDENKITAEVATKVAALPKQAIIPLSQHIGAPAKAVVKKGDKVKAGDLLCIVDMALMKSKGYPMHTPILLTNGDDCGEIQLLPAKKAQAGKTVVARYRL